MKVGIIFNLNLTHRILAKGFLSRFVFMWLIINFSNSVAAQFITPPEKFILDLLKRDTSSSTTIYFIPEVKLGLSWKGHSYLAAAKEQQNTYIILAGTQQVYEVDKTSYSLIRIDSSYHFGDNYNCMTFMLNDTLYQYGGYGFWQNRDFFSRFDKTIGQWEYIQGGDVMGNRLTLNYLDRNNNSFYVFGQYFQNTSKDFNAEFRDSIYRYNLPAKKWESLGKISQNWIKEMFHKVEMHNGAFYTPWGLAVISPQSGMFHLFDFEKNRAIPMKRNRFDSVSKLFRAAQHNLNNPSFIHIFLNDTLHYVALDKTRFNHIQTKLDTTYFDFKAQIPIYIPAEHNNSITWGTFSTNKIYSYLAIPFLFISILYLGLKFRKRKIQMSSEANENLPEQISSEQKVFFLSSLPEVEKLFLSELKEHSSKNKKMSIETINHILGVGQKDYESQKVRRSQAISRINECYRRIYKTDQTLIQKEKNEQDRRAYDYFIPAELIKSIS